MTNFNNLFFFFLYSVAVVAIKEEKIACSDSMFHGNVHLPHNVLNTNNTIDSDNSTIIDDVTCLVNKYDYDENVISQFLAAYFYGNF